MLVIRRRAGESLLIGDGVEIHVLEVGPSSVKLGIQAPREVPVLRREIYVTAMQNRSAAGLPGGYPPKAIECLLAVTRKDRSKPVEPGPNLPDRS